MIRFAIYRVLAFLLARYELIPAPDGAAYLSRWHFPRWLARWHAAEYLFLHYFHTSDPDRGWHCHPWRWCESRLLRGSYTQEIRRLVHPWRGPGRPRTEYKDFVAGDTNYLGAEFHRVTLGSRPVWTLFRAGAKHGKSWGFINEAGVYTPANDPRGMQ